MTATRLDPFEAGLEATSQLWDRLARPFDLTATAESLLGLAPDVVTELAGLSIATCTEADALLEAMPATLRNLKTSVHATLERCVGELRGPVQWSETLAAQGSSLGNRDVYICSSTRRAYDIEENQVLVAALKAVMRAGNRLRELDAHDAAAADLDRARHNARAARRFLDHRSLESVRLEGRPSTRAIKRTRSGKSARAYRPALAMLDRASEPLALADMAAFCDRRTRVQHGVLLTIIQELERRGLRVPALRAESGSFFAGPVEYLHPRRRRRDGVHGIVIGGVLVDIDDGRRGGSADALASTLQARAHGRAVVPIVGPDDVVAAVDRAIVVARGG
ncbi:MAG: hypothetical protein AAGC53_12975 [Actinomycetota bacterium]